MVAEVLDELGVRESTVGVAPVGMLGAGLQLLRHRFSRGRPRACPGRGHGHQARPPDLTVFTYQGDGDLASIGAAEILHCANRGEKVTVVFVNNAIYGMTGGQMAPTTMPGQVATTCPLGRDVEHAGQPLRVAEMLSTLHTPAFIARGSAHTPLQAVKTKEMLRKAFTYQTEGICFSLVEILSTCPTNWGIPPAEATQWLEETMLPYYPLGTFKTPESGDRAAAPLDA
jgi:2-oxoglutarate ferredoxin oxidoreductase subunit beta